MWTRLHLLYRHYVFVPPPSISFSTCALFLYASAAPFYFHCLGRPQGLLATECIPLGSPSGNVAYRRYQALQPSYRHATFCLIFCVYVFHNRYTATSRCNRSYSFNLALVFPPYAYLPSKQHRNALSPDICTISPPPLYMHVRPASSLQTVDPPAHAFSFFGRTRPCTYGMPLLPVL